MIIVIVTKNKGSDKKDDAIFKRVVEIAKFTFGVDGKTEVLMFRKKHYGKKPDILIIVEKEQDIILEMERKIRENFDYSRLDMNADVSVHKIFPEAADYQMQF